MKPIDINRRSKKKVDQVSILVSLLSQDFANRMNAIKNQEMRNEAMACILLYVIECLKNGHMDKNEVSKIIEFGLNRNFSD